MKKQCTKCGYKNNPKNSDYCINCGVKLDVPKENINNLIIEHRIEKEYETKAKIEQLQWYMKYEKIYLEFKVKLLEEIQENLEIIIEIIGNNGETIKKYRESIFKSEQKQEYTYQKILTQEEEFNSIKKVIIYPEKLNKRFENLI